jgi:hypothetical protein
MTIEQYNFKQPVPTRGILRVMRRMKPIVLEPGITGRDIGLPGFTARYTLDTLLDLEGETIAQISVIPARRTLVDSLIFYTKRDIVLAHQYSDSVYELSRRGTPTLLMGFSGITTGLHIHRAFTFLKEY